MSYSSTSLQVLADQSDVGEPGLDPSVAAGLDHSVTTGLDPSVTSGLDPSVTSALAMVTASSPHLITPSSAENDLIHMSSLSGQLWKQLLKYIVYTYESPSPNMLMPSSRSQIIHAGVVYPVQV